MTGSDSSETDRLYEAVQESPDEKVLKVDKQDGRISWLFVSDNGTLRRKTPSVLSGNPRVGKDLLRQTVEQSSYEVSVEDRERMEDALQDD